MMKKINEVVAKALKDENLSGFDILVGSALTDEFGLHKNDKLSLIFSNLNPSGFSLVPQTKRFDVKARFTSGLAFYDKAYMYTDVDALKKYLEYLKIQIMMGFMYIAIMLLRMLKKLNLI